MSPVLRKQKDGSYNVYDMNNAGRHAGLVRKNRDNVWVATSFGKGVSIFQGVMFKTRLEAASWLCQ